MTDTTLEEKVDALEKGSAMFADEIEKQFNGIRADLNEQLAAIDAEIESVARFLEDEGGMVEAAA